MRVPAKVTRLSFARRFVFSTDRSSRHCDRVHDGGGKQEDRLKKRLDFVPQSFKTTLVNTTTCDNVATPR